MPTPSTKGVDVTTFFATVDCGQRTGMGATRMTEPLQLLLAGGIAVFAGTIGSLVGVGGGLIIVPALTVFLGVPFKIAAGASLVGVIATSNVAGRRYLVRGLVDRPLGLLLLVATALGALSGGYVAALLDAQVLSALFAVVLIGVALHVGRSGDPVSRAAGPDAASLAAPYGRRTLAAAMGISTIAGALSGLLGIGGGIINVPTMCGLLHVPFRIAVATSTYMLGATAAASSSVYYARGQLDPLIAAPVALGIAIGAYMGSRLAPRVRVATLRLVFAGLCVVLAVQLILKLI